MGRNADFDQVTIDTIVDGSSGNTHDPDDIGGGGGSNTEVAVARKTSNQTVSTTGSWIGITLDTNPITKLTGISTTNNNFVPPKDGVYRIEAQVNANFGNSASTDVRILETSGAETLSISQMGNGSSSSDTHQALAVADLTTTDTIVFQVRTNNLGGTSDVGGTAGETKFTVTYLGTA